MSLMVPGHRLLLEGSGFAHSLQNGLVAYWPLDEASGTRRDLSGNGLTLTDNNSVLSAAGPSSKLPVAASFNGATQSLSRADHALLSYSGDFTATIWMYINALPIVGSAVEVFQKRTDSTVAEWGIQINNVLGTIRFRSYIYNGTFRILTDTRIGTPILNIWYNVTITYSSSGALLSMMINNNAADTLSIFGGDPSDTASILAIGNLGTPVFNSYLNGRAVGAGLWKRLWVPSEHSYMYNNGNGRALIPGRGLL